MTGIIKKIPYEIKEIEWSIVNFFTESQEERQQLYDSPPFSFGDSDGPWFMLLYPRWRETDGFVFLKFFRELKLEHSVECYFGLKRSDGSVEQLSSSVLPKGKAISDPINLIKKSDLLNRKFQLVPNNTLTISFTMKFITDSAPLAVYKTNSRNVISNGIACEKNQSVLNEQNCGLVLKVGNREFPVHQAILKHSNILSQIFETILDHAYQNSNCMINGPSSDAAKTIEQFLLYVFCARVEIINDNNVLRLYELAYKYDMAQLLETCRDFIMKSISSASVCKIIQAASKHNDSELLESSTECFCSNVEDILNTVEWQCFLKDNFFLANDMLKKSVFKLKNPKAIEIMTVE